MFTGGWAHLHFETSRLSQIKCSAEAVVFSTDVKITYCNYLSEVSTKADEKSEKSDQIRGR